MTRFSAAAAISIFLLLLIPLPGHTEERSLSCPAGEVLKDGVCLADEGKCFPWQEYRGGSCVAKSTAPAPTLALPVQCTGGTADASGRCVCPANTHLDAAGSACLADVAPPRKASDAVVCDGGALTDGRCVCPSGFQLMPASSSIAGSGTCVRTDASNCQGGELTVAGTCFCNGRVTMSGENYALELVGGKCIPKRCPEHTYLKDGQCVASNDAGFAFTCRTGYLPDEANPGTAATGLHCLPDPSFCDAGVKRRSGSCPKSSAVAIDCFDAKCVCRDPHADWVNYLCQCAEPYRNVNGSCVSEVTAHAAPGPEEKAKPEQASEPSDEPARQKTCGHGMIRSHGTCVAAKRRYPAAAVVGGTAPGEYYLRQGSRTYHLPGYSIPQQGAQPGN